ncbi:hypothetical protein V493_08434 [Pseudogymnoascus sp. VKM F-4281 (FW-2241)]|nr:hypothetical protein V493_08434 [Pseudogymnoascus sp. VKM F-4281 (FW-2241)]
MMVAFAVPRVLPLKLPRLQKAGLIAITSLSSLVIISSVIRLVRISALRTGTDLSWDSYDFTTWSAIEVNVGLFCATAPAIRPAIRTLKEALRLHTPPTTNRDARFPTSMSGGLELEDGKDFNPTPPLSMPANSTYWITNTGRATKQERSDEDSPVRVLNAASLNRTPESGRSRSVTESDREM